jgi:hypothetical protein
MSRFQNKSNNNLFRKKSINRIQKDEPVLEELVIVSQEVPVKAVEEVINIVEQQQQQQQQEEPIILLEEIYEEVNVNEPKEEIKLEENPIQIELKKRRSKERFQLLVQEVILNKKKQNIEGWIV